MKRLAPRLIFLAALAGGLLSWSQLRRPRDLVLEVDLSEALPGEIVEADVVVRRGGHALARHDVRYGPAGAPGLLQIPVHAAPGAVEVEVTLVPAKGPARRTSSALRLAAGAPGRLHAR